MVVVVPMQVEEEEHCMVFPIAVNRMTLVEQQVALLLVLTLKEHFEAVEKALIFSPHILPSALLKPSFYW